MESFGPSGEALSDYALRDATAAGASAAAFVIRAELEPAFQEHHRRHAPALPVRYAHQDLSSLPPGRTKPWGPTHAVLAAAPVLDGSFAVVNADDYDGPEAYRAVARFFAGPDAAVPVLGIVGYRLRDTLSLHGGVSRGVIEADEDGWQRLIREVTGLRTEGAGVVGQREGETLRFTGTELVSMKCWAFPSDVLPLLSAAFARFLQRSRASGTGECPLPDTVQELVARDEVRVRLLEGGRTWFGVTYPADRPAVVDRLRTLESCRPVGEVPHVSGH